MIKPLLKIVELTVPEQRVVIIAVAAVVAFAAFKTYRSGTADSPRVLPTVDVDQPSPSPGIRP